MKSIFTITFLLALFVIPSAGFAVESTTKVNPMTDPPIFLTAEELSQLKVSEYEELTGRDLNFKERLGLMNFRKMMKKQIRKGNVEEEALLPVPARFSMNWGAFVLGLFLPLIGILIALLFFEDPNAWISALIGGLIGILLGIALFIS